MVFLPGDLVGLKAMLVDRQPDTLRSITAATVQALDSEQALDLAGTNLDVALRFMWQLAEEERRTQNRLIALGRGHAVERIATLMLDLHGRLKRADLAKGNSFHMPMTQEELGDHLGLTYVHVNRTLRRLREEGILTLARGRVSIDDIAALSAYSAPMQDIFEREINGFDGSILFASSISL